MLGENGQKPKAYLHCTLTTRSNQRATSPALSSLTFHILLFQHRSSKRCQRAMTTMRRVDHSKRQRRQHPPPPPPSIASQTPHTPVFPMIQSHEPGLAEAGHEVESEAGVDARVRGFVVCAVACQSRLAFDPSYLGACPHKGSLGLATDRL